MKKHLIVKNGNLTPAAKNVSAAIGLAAVAGLYILDDLNDYRAWGLAIVAVFFGLGAAWGGLMQKWGFRPFTNDPHGWRKGKSTERKDTSDN